jgi:putative restriction endonuclease
MNSFERTLIHKAGYNHGWEVVVEDTPDRVVLASALHKAQAYITEPLPGARWFLTLRPRQLLRELERVEWDHILTDEYFNAENEAELSKLLSHAARFARALPDAPEARFTLAVKKELSATTITTTEVERLVRQRIGQCIYRESLMDYWDGACAVTGIAVPELLRASHAKGWAECTTDSERLNVFNGFLLAAHLDALFDRHLMTFGHDGAAVFAPAIDDALQVKLGLTGQMKLRWISPDHLPFLEWHRTKFHG